MGENIPRIPKMIAIDLYESMRRRQKFCAGGEEALSIIDAIEGLFPNEQSILDRLLEASVESGYISEEDSDWYCDYLGECVKGRCGCDSAEKFWSTCFTPDGALVAVSEELKLCAGLLLAMPTK